ncbi:MAG: hypothetical protein V4517_01555 [Pseudomonadota bacterium]
MTETLFAIVGIVLLVGFIFFAFRQGMKVKPNDHEDRSNSIGGP